MFCVQELQALTGSSATKFSRNMTEFVIRSQDGKRNEHLLEEGALRERRVGAEEVGHLESERRMFWVRLRLKPSATTYSSRRHMLTAARNRDEAETGLSQGCDNSNESSTNYAAVRQAEPAFFLGDMNDAYHPQRILKQAGFVSCFAALGMQSPPTFQCYPTANVQPDEPTVTEAIDLIVANRYARAIAASVPQCYCEDTAPSDHWPVQAVYQLV